jgi:hypothetical protein
VRGNLIAERSGTRETQANEHDDNPGNGSQRYGHGGHLPYPPKGGRLAHFSCVSVALGSDRVSLEAI